MPSLQQLRPALLAAIVFVLAFDAAFLWQQVGGARVSEFGGHPDEAAHYVTGLMIRDYVAARFPGAPMKYADDYYSHYPKIALGIWPPVFYVVQAAWTLPFGVSRAALMLLMCVLAAVASMLVFVSLREDYGGFIGGLGALLFISLPLVREYYGMVMAETLSTVFIFGATLAFGNFLDRGRARDAWIFGILSALAILTKGTGVALAPMAGLALLFTRRWAVLKRPVLWGAVVLIAVLAGPWTWFFRKKGAGGWEQAAPSLAWSREAIVYFLTKFGISLGILVLLFFVVGVLVRLRAVSKAASAAPASESAGEVETKNPPSTSGRWACMGALIVAVIVFQSIVPAGKEARHLIPTLPAAVAFAMAGFAFCLQGAMKTFRLSSELTPFPLRNVRAALPLLLAGTILVAGSVFPITARRWSGFAQLAVDALREAQPADTMLISSDANGEGMFIAEIAMRDPKRPSYTVKRASKELAASEWSGRGYHEKYESDDDLLGFLTGKVRYLAMDDTMPESKRVPHHDTLKRVVDVDSGHFWQLGTSEIWRGGEAQMAPARLFRIEKSDSAKTPDHKTK